MLNGNGAGDLQCVNRWFGAIAVSGPIGISARCVYYGRMTHDDQTSPQVSGTHWPDVLDVVSDAIFIIDRDRRILLANHAARNLSGPIVVGQDFVRVIRNPDCLRCVDAVLSGDYTAQDVFTLTHPVATVCRVNVVGLEAGSDEAPRAVVSIADVSQIQDAEKMRSDFVANVSHELRSPLTALSGFIETLKGAAKDDPEAREHFLSVMEGEASRMQRLIDDLLSLSKVEINARVRPTDSADIVAIIERVIRTLSLQAEARSKSIRLDVAENLPSVRGDSDDLTQVFQNLIENAINYSSAESDVLVFVTHVAEAAGVVGPVLRVDVRDEGAGIPRAHLPRLTERFYRVDDGRGRHQGGTGLGLAIVKHVVSRHRGRLQIKSDVGRGSTFSVYLPVDQSASR